jgi:hypothetical protein
MPKTIESTARVMPSAFAPPLASEAAAGMPKMPPTTAQIATIQSRTSSASAPAAAAPCRVALAVRDGVDDVHDAVDDRVDAEHPDERDRGLHRPHECQDAEDDGEDAAQQHEPPDGLDELADLDDVVGHVVVPLRSLRH